LQILLPADFHARLGGYLRESRRPLTSLVFVLPLLAAYELGVLIVPTTMRNGADAWMRRLLDVLGFGGYFLLPCLTVAVLLAWHHVLREPWRVSRRALLWMVGESLGLAIILIGLAHLQGYVLFVSAPGGWLGSTTGSPQVGPLGASVAVATFDPSHPVIFNFTHPATFDSRHPAGLFGGLGRIVAFCGAGLYEEVLFRLMLLPAAARLCGLAGLRRQWKAGAAVVITSLLFSLAHYVGAGGDAWDFSSFFFRFLAGAFFAVLFVTRGFGITAGTHAIYDVLVGVG
jgi:membrane protease YdiL (CAAX protease family)